MDKLEMPLGDGAMVNSESAKEVSGGGAVVVEVKDVIDPVVEVVVKPMNDLALSDDGDDEGEEEEERLPRFLGDMPPEVQRRIQALRKNQLQIIEIETNFFKEMHQLEVKYEKLYQQQFDFRKTIVTGDYEPTDMECTLPIGTEIPPPVVVDRNGNSEEERSPPMSGVPTFWSTILQNVEPASSLVEDPDMPILKHLTDVRCENMSDPMGFKLFFCFSPNEFFENEELVKTYVMKNDPDPEHPLEYDGPEIISCEGCSISWKKGKDVTTKTVEKRQKHKKNGTIRTVTKVVKMNSFFNFFNPPDSNNSKAETSEDDEDDIIDTLNFDFEVGQMLRERIIPRAVLFFTGEAIDDDDDDTDFATDTEDTDDGENSQSEIDEQGDQP